MMDNNPAEQLQEPQGLNFHMGVAEQGKIYAVQGNHKLALMYYQSAIAMTVQAGDPELFFRLYLESALESMEHLGLYEEVLDYCNRALQLYEDNPPPNEFARIDFAHIHQRKGIILYKLQRKEEAVDYLKKAIALIQAEKGKFPLAEKMLRWIQGGYHVDEKRIIDEQKRDHYFSVTKEALRPERAIKLPGEHHLAI